MWRKLNDFPNYEISTTGYVRNINTKKLLKERNMNNSMSHVTIKYNQGLKHLQICDLLNRTYTHEEIQGEILFLRNIFDKGFKNKIGDAKTKQKIMKWTGQKIAQTSAMLILLLS